MSSLPLRRRSYNTELKLRVIKYAEENGNRAAEREFDVSEACVRLWRKQKDMLENLPWYRKAARPGMKAFWPDLESDLYNWIQQQRQMGINITLKGIQNKAQELSMDTKHNIPPGVFKGNISWVNRFMKRHTITLRCRKGDGSWHFPITSCHKIQEQILAQMAQRPLENDSDNDLKPETGLDDNSLLSMEVTFNNIGLMDEQKEDNPQSINQTADIVSSSALNAENTNKTPNQSNTQSHNSNKSVLLPNLLPTTQNPLPVDKLPSLLLTGEDKCDPFWWEMKDIFQACQLKYVNPNWGPKKIIEVMNHSTMTEGHMKLIFRLYCYNPITEKIYLKEQGPNLPQRECVTRERLSELMIQMHNPCHLSFEAIYETLRQRYYPCVHIVMKTIFNIDVLSSCVTCQETEDPLEFRSEGFRNPIFVKYPNSRWQVCVKQLIPCREYNYVCLITDCFSRFSFGEALTGKTSADIAQLLTRLIFLLGAPRIIHMDNGSEFYNCDLANAIYLLDTEKIPGCPYCPVTQGTVEEFNRILLKQLQEWLDSTDEKNWPDRLQEMLFVYNNTVQKATKPDTPYQWYFSRPNFATIFLSPQPEGQDLSKEEKAFLDMVNMDVSINSESDDE